MTNLKLIYNQWNKAQQAYYKPVLEVLFKNKIISDLSLIRSDFNDLCNTTKIHRQKLRAFVKQVQIDMLTQDKFSQTIEIPVEMEPTTADTTTETRYLSTSFESLDKLLTCGFHFGQVIELCGESDSGKTRFISHVLASYISSYSTDGVFLFDTTGLLEPRRMGGTFIKKRMDPHMLTQTEYAQAFNLHTLTQLLENLAALVTGTEDVPPLVIIDDLSRLMGSNWATTTAADFVQMVQVLAKRFHCCIIVLHHIAAKDLMADNSTQQFDKFWNPVIDLRLHFSEKTDTSNRVQVIKARCLVDPNSCYIQLH